MLYWIVDHATLVYFLLVLVGVAFFLVWRQTRGPRSRWGMLGVVVVTAVVWVLTLTVTTDRQRLRSSLEAMVEAALQGEADKLLKLFAPEFSLQGHDRKFVAEHAGPTARKHSIQAISLYQFRYEHLSRSEGKAKVRFGARVERGGGEFHLLTCVAHFTLGGERWLLRDLEVFLPVVNQDKPLQIPFEAR